MLSRDDKTYTSVGEAYNNTRRLTRNMNPEAAAEAWQDFARRFHQSSAGPDTLSGASGGIEAHSNPPLSQDEFTHVLKLAASRDVDAIKDMMNTREVTRDERLAIADALLRENGALPPEFAGPDGMLDPYIANEIYEAHMIEGNIDKLDYAKIKRKSAKMRRAFDIKLLGLDPSASDADIAKARKKLTPEQKREMKRRRKLLMDAGVTGHAAVLPGSDLAAQLGAAVRSEGISTGNTDEYRESSPRGPSEATIKRMNNHRPSPDRLNQLKTIAKSGSRESFDLPNGDEVYVLRSDGSLERGWIFKRRADGRAGYELQNETLHGQGKPWRKPIDLTQVWHIHEVEGRNQQRESFGPNSSLLN